MNRKYNVILTITISVLVLNQVFIQYILNQKQYDAKTINVAGKQRMLSQRINLESYKISVGKGDQRELELLFDEWESNHEALLNGSDQNKIKAIEDPNARILLIQLTSKVERMKDFVESAKGNNASLDIEAITKNQDAFLSEMDKTVMVLEIDAQNKLNRVILIELVILLVTILLISMEVRFIFYPMNKDLVDKNSELERRNKELKKYSESNLYLSRFASIISHDLKAPMGAIRSFTDLLRMSDSEPSLLSPEQREYMNFISTSVTKMSSLVDDLTRLASLEDSELKRSQLDLENLLSFLVTELEPIIAQKNAVIKFEDLPEYIVADEVKMRLIFQNLITNALKYDRPEERPRVVISCKETAGEWEFKISDNGRGIEPGFEEKIFEIFIKIQKGKEVAGSGVGLALVKKAVEKHSGQIRVTSEVNKGSSFIFSIPKKESLSLQKDL